MTKTIFDNINPETFEKVQKLRLIDDELMSIVFSGDKKVTEFLIRILLNRNDLRVKKSMTQVQKPERALKGFATIRQCWIVTA
jgi:hypothetical protein